MVQYHDNEWGTPQRDDQKLFEMLCLEGAQAGLSWLTVLKKRDAYRIAFDGFDPDKMANYTEKKRATLLQNEGIIRNKLKVNAFIENAKAYLVVVKQYGTFAAYVWQFNSGNSPFTHRQQAKAQAASVAMSVQLKKDGFKFIGPTICFAFMQATGMINDHEKGCFLAK
jgi:DNA-3-methyladenine glycosylase I